MVCFRQVETKQVQNGNDHMKLPGNPEVQGKIGDQKADQLKSIGYISRGHHEVIINVAIQDQVYHPAQHPLYSSLVNSVLVIIVVRPAKSTVIDNGKERKDDVWQ